MFFCATFILDNSPKFVQRCRRNSYLIFREAFISLALRPPFQFLTSRYWNEVLGQELSTHHSTGAPWWLDQRPSEASSPYKMSSFFCEIYLQPHLSAQLVLMPFQLLYSCYGKKHSVWKYCVGWCLHTCANSTEQFARKVSENINCYHDDME